MIFFSKSSFAEIGSDTWSKDCNKDNEKNCFIAIKNTVANDQDLKQTLATAYIQIAFSKQKKMDLIDKKDQTYKLSELEKAIPMLFVNLPLNSDLRKAPLIQADKISLGNLRYLHCNNKIGCKTMVILNEKVIDAFRKGNSLTVTLAVFGMKQNVQINFPLKGFSKAYKKLVKG
ncbi:invasion associated locus B family protein [Candidatus Pelagibacter ubique]|uniref:invasion associated locus B family protein n=1 Tax=Pelagibacter ubique TaxID=198252 RepID=UPI000411D232